MHQWYFHSGSDASRIGPLDDAAARDHARRHPDARCWREGFVDWMPVRSVAELDVAPAGPPPHLPPVPTGTASRSDEIDYRIVGNDMQFVEIELDPGESAVAEAGALMCKDAACRWTRCSATAPQRPGRRLHGQAAVAPASA